MGRIVALTHTNGSTRDVMRSMLAHNFKLLLHKTALGCCHDGAFSFLVSPLHEHIVHMPLCTCYQFPTVTIFTGEIRCLLACHVSGGLKLYYAPCLLSVKPIFCSLDACPTGITDRVLMLYTIRV